MKNLTIALLASFCLFITFLGCKKDKEENQKPQNEVRFSVNLPGTDLKSTYSTLSNARKIVLTVQKADGSLTRYKDYALNIFFMNGNPFSDYILLETGSYKLTFFVLLDSANHTIFSAPQAGSSLAKLVATPLPLIFSVNSNSSKSVNVQVISTLGKTPPDFGLISFDITTVPVFRFMTGVFSKVANKFIPANLTITASSFTLSKYLDSIANNTVTIKDLPNTTYLLKIEATGIQTMYLSLTTDSLKKFSPDNLASFPLIFYVENLKGTVIDNEGNVYKTVKIGSQWWMAENLKTTHYNNGNPIKEIDPFLDIRDSVDKRYFCAYGTGRIFYTWYAINDSRGVCPAGWHIPTEAEWQALVNYNGGPDLAGIKLMDVISWNFINPAVVVTNESGFSAQGTGIRTLTTLDDGERWYITGFWSSTSLTNNKARAYYMYAESNGVDESSTLKGYGLPVRCIKDYNFICL